MTTDVATIAAHPALDLVGTIAERNRARLEHLPSPDALGDWLTRAGIWDQAPAVSETDLEAAKELREALYELLVAATNPDRCTLPASALAVVNAAADQPPTSPRLTHRGQLHRTGTTSAALSTIARSALELLGGPDRERLKWCADDHCTHPFIDRSRAGQRRWCGMSGCGDRAKARAYRERRQRG